MRTRTISAIIAVALLGAVFYFWREKGMMAITTLVGLGCIYEYCRMMFVRLDTPLHLRGVFLLLGAAILGTTAFAQGFALEMTAIASVFFFTMSLLTISRATDLPMVLQVVSYGALGFVYCGTFSGLTIRLLNLEQGTIWFFGLLAIVFSGDTFAYLTGRLFGKTKLLEPVSPKKTVEGSLGGLAGSALAGIGLGVGFLPELPLGWLILTALATGTFAQVGDLFESLLKRVAEVKDSGAIMPGHGGMLDRVDGVIFAAPIYYVLAKYLGA